MFNPHPSNQPRKWFNNKFNKNYRKKITILQKNIILIKDEIVY